MAEDIKDFIARAITDPDSVVEDWPNEPRINHQARAVMSLLEVVFGPDRDGFHAGTPASRALMENSALRGTVARLTEDVELWRRRALEAGWRLGIEDGANV